MVLRGQVMIVQQHGVWLKSYDENLPQERGL